MTRSSPLFAVMLMTVVLLSSCQGAASTESDAASPTAADSGVASSAQTPEPNEQVEYEPAYPTDVSAEGLSEDDVAQHEATHSHDGEEHTHGEDSHTHDEDEDDGDHQH